MKNIFKLLCAAAAGLAIVASCDLYPNYEGELLASSISVDKSEVTLESTGSIAAEINITSAGDWIIVAPEGLSVNPLRGTGNRKVSISAPDNVDDVYHEVQGPKSFKLNICGTDITVPVTVNQKGEAGLDASRTYSKITKAEDFEDGKGYLIVTKDVTGKYQNCVAVPASKPYGWPALASIDGNGEVFTMPDATKAYTFIGTADSFLIKQADGRYWYQTGTYTSFNVTDDPSVEGTLFKLSFNEDGSARIVNIAMEKVLQCAMKASGASYDEYLSDSSLGDGCQYPCLYKDSKASTGEVLSVSDVTVDALATSARIAVKSNATTGWRVRCHDGWVKSFTKSGNGDGYIDLSFDANPSYDEDKVAEVMVLGETTGITVKLVQSKYVPSLSVDPETISAPADATTARFEVKANTPWTVSCPAGVTAEPSSGDSDATVVLSFAANGSEEDIIYTVTVSGSDTHLATKDLTVTVNHMNASAKVLPYSEPFDTSVGGFSIEDVQLPSGTTYVWKHSGNADYGMKASAYFSKQAHESESWLISPAIDLTKEKSAQVTYSICAANGESGKYDEACYGVVIDGDNTTKVDLGFGAAYPAKYAWIDGKVDLTAFAGKKIKFAFVYKSTVSNCPTVEVKKVCFDIKQNTFAEIIAAGAGSYNNKNALVVAVGSTNTVLTDGTAYMFMYDKNKVSKVGDMLSLSGNTTIYNGCPEWNNPSITVISSGNEVRHPEPVTLDEAGLAAYAEAPVVEYGFISGPKAGYYITLGTQKANLYSNDKINDGNVEVYGYTIGYHSKNLYTLFVVSSYSYIQ